MIRRRPVPRLSRWRARLFGIDAHPDAPPRRPLSVAELSRAARTANFDRAERRIPDDLETPLSALDPMAIPDVPRTPVRPVVPLAPDERLRTFALKPAPPSDVAESAPAPSGIEKLLRRLSAG